MPLLAIPRTRALVLSALAAAALVTLFLVCRATEVDAGPARSAVVGVR